MNFLKKAEAENARGVIFDIPLFFETGGDKTGLMDYIVVVHAGEEIQRQRTLERPEMNEKKFEAIKQQQMPSAEKCRRADFIVETEKGLPYARAQVKIILEKIDAANRQAEKQ
jgi:dephospho-CoA kinase